VSETPIYDQLRGERINADVPATRTEQQRVTRPERTRLRDETAGVKPMFGRSPEVRAGLAIDQRHAVAVEQAVQAAVEAARRAESSGPW
jgi:hypothetical protein